MTIESSPGDGASSVFRVPPAAPAEAAIRVLVVDDHQIIRQGLALLLEGEKGIMVVGEAGDGAEALEAARKLRPDVVLMDVTMPKLNGMEATRLVVAEMPSVRVIGLSMHDDADMASSMLGAGAVAYVNKSGPAQELVAAIRTAAARPPGTAASS